MAKKKPPTPTSQARATRSTQSPRPPAPARPNPLPSSGPKRTLPAKSVEKAKSAFSKFTLSKFAGKEPPPNYVTKERTLTGVQRRLISNKIDTLKSSPPNRSMTLALPPGQIEKLLPSFDSKSGRVQLGDVLGAIQQRMSGTEFYARGNPTLNRLAVEANAQQILKTITKAGKK